MVAVDWQPEKDDEDARCFARAAAAMLLLLLLLLLLFRRGAPPPPPPRARGAREVDAPLLQQRRRAAARLREHLALAADALEVPRQRRAVAVGGLEGCLRRRHRRCEVLQLLVLLLEAALQLFHFGGPGLLLLATHALLRLELDLERREARLGLGAQRPLPLQLELELRVALVGAVDVTSR